MRPLKLNIHQTLKTLRNADLSAAARIAIDDLLQAVAPGDEFEIDLYEPLRRNRMIPACWSTDDVQAIRPHLTIDQAWKVLQEANKSDDPFAVLDWADIASVADKLFPEEPETDEA